MQPQAIADFLLARYPGLVAVNAWGEQSFFYNPGGLLPRGVYFATLKDKDGDNDKASNLGRDGVFRFNFGVSKASYENTFGGAPSFLRRRYTKDLSSADIAVTGIPFDMAVTNRPGTRLGPRGIRVNAVCPGYIATGLAANRGRPKRR